MIFIALNSCKNQTVEEAISDTTHSEIDAQAFPKRSQVNSKAQGILADWGAFQALETSFDALYRVENNEDLILVIEDLINKQNELEDSEYPEEFNVPQIKSRQKVFKTFLLKAKAAQEYRINTQEPVEEMIAAYNAWRDQFNVIVNNVLDTNLIFDE